ncbi:electron transport complex subunit RsxA [Marinicella gelatinilytica]|uniref:electron transport complex subunit RsxA n=1 Tax=Marinicella gelatinilytica TaxID=2996017 RepID=UPI002260BFF9|nr:electron transport complex subunit RsxA [Marinicella gelatinilytica]MCX7544057.1 electron transport complex subunit RsxA [Marinicella gelatinilytica]
MTGLFVIFISAAFVNNFVLVRFLGLCPFMGVSTQYKSALGMSYATAFVLTLSSIVSYLVNEYLLVPLEIEYLKTLSFILVIAVTVQMTEMILHKSSPMLYQVLGLFLPLITTNCAVLGVALLNVQQQNSLLESAFFGFGAAVGFGLVLVLFSAIRERLEMANIPQSFQGIPIALITAGIMALAFMGFSGMVST